MVDHKKSHSREPWLGSVGTLVPECQKLSLIVSEPWPHSVGTFGPSVRIGPKVGTLVQKCLTLCPVVRTFVPQSRNLGPIVSEPSHSVGTLVQQCRNLGPIVSEPWSNVKLELVSFLRGGRVKLEHVLF